MWFFVSLFIIKTMRPPLEAVASTLFPLRQLLMTPSEALEIESDFLCSARPFTSKDSPDNDGDQVLATPAES